MPAQRALRLVYALTIGAATAVTGPGLAPAALAAPVPGTAAPATTVPAPAATAGLKAVPYQGYTFYVPTTWPVIDLAANPATCVRFDLNAIYLGTPGAAENCPARVTGVTEAVLVEPAASTVPVTSVDNPVSQRITVTSPRISLTASYGKGRTLILNILSSAGLPLPGVVVPQPSLAVVSPAPPPDTPDYTGRAFDACTAPSASAMSAWLGSSPYRAIGVYIGGSDRGCSQPNLTSGWVSQQATAGWHFMPIYVGPQAASGEINSPASQGTSAANDAISQAVSLRLNAGTPLYYDMEGGYPSGDDSAVVTFLTAWTNQLHSYGWESGVYSSGAYGVTLLANNYGGNSTPDVIWDAHYTGVDSTSDAYLPSGDWNHHQRIVQYTGGGNETYGGVTISVDENAMDVLLPYGGTRQDSQAVAQSGGTVDVMYKGTNGQLEHNWYNGAWSGPQSMGGEGMLGEPSVTTGRPGTVDAFFQGANGHLWYASYAGSWSSEQDLSAMGTLGGPPKAVAQQDGVIDVFWKGTGTSPALWHAWYRPGAGWAGPQNLGGNLASDPAPVESSPGVVDVFFEGSDANLWHAFFRPANGWITASSLSMGPLGGPPHATAQIDGTIDVFWKGTGTRPALWHAWYGRGSAWAGPQSLGGSLASDPAPVASAPGIVDTFFKGSDGNLWHAFYRPGSGWISATSLGMGPLGGGPYASAEPEGTIDVFWKGTGTTPPLTHGWYRGATWAGPQSLGGSVG